MRTDGDPGIVEQHERQRGRTLIELTRTDDGTWVATQSDVDVRGTGETGALAAMDYCRRIAERHHEESQ